VSHPEVVAGAGGDTVTLSPDSIDELKQAAAGSGAANGARTAAPGGSTSVGATSNGAASAGHGGSAGTNPDGAAGGTVNGEAAGRGSTGTNAAGSANRAGDSGGRAGTATTKTATGTQPCTAALPPVALGQVGTFSGVAGAITAPARAALAVWAKDVNSRGGLACHPVQLFATDDGADTSRAATAEHDMVHQHHVVAFVDVIVPLTVAGFRPAVEADKVPVVGGVTGTDDFYQSPWLFPEAASFSDQAFGLVRSGVELGKKRLGLLYCVEAGACTGLEKKVKQFAPGAGAELVYDAPISLTQPDFSAQCINARDAKVDLLGAAMDGASITRLVRSCQSIGYQPLIATSGALLTPAQAEDEVLRQFGVVTVSGEAPWFLTDQPGLRAYHAALTKYAPDLPPDAESVRAWACGELLRIALDHLGADARSGPITTAVVLRGLGTLAHETVGGLIAPLTFSPGQSHASSTGCMFFEHLTTTGWAAPRGSKAVCIR
jgi:branched-chain amino acid transport system substrate-binding protein